MLLVRDPENRELLTELIQALYEELPAPKPKRAKESLTILKRREKHENRPEHAP